MTPTSASCCALAEADGVALSEVLRRALRLYAAQHGATPATRRSTPPR